MKDLVHGEQHTLVLSGELSRESVPVFEAAIVLLCAQGSTAMALDLGNLTLVDSAGLRSISLARKLCDSHECEFSLAPLSRAFNASSQRLRAPLIPAAERRAAHERRSLTPRVAMR
ncbi:MAG: STAS domain-containing protein [Solirubrobacteraceae bacterium]